MSKLPLFALILLVVPGIAQAGDAKKPPVQTFDGIVQPLEIYLKNQGVLADPGDRSLVLVSKDGKVMGLVKDDVTRLLFRDDRLQNKALRLHARVVAGTSILQVEEVLSMKNGQPHKIFYWCETCQLSYTEAGKCICCGADTVLREVPVE